MISFERDKNKRATHVGSSCTNTSASEKQHLKRMTEETEEENQSKKRKKWLENLIVLSSEDEEDLCSTAVHKEEKHNIFKNDEVIYLRFPYYMGSDNSDDEEEIKFFPDISPQKRKDNVILSSSNVSNYASKENRSYKHRKRKQRSDSKAHNVKGDNLASSVSSKENKENPKKYLKTKNRKFTKKIHMNKKVEDCSFLSLKSSKSTRDPLSPISRLVEDKTKKTRQSKTKSLDFAVTDNYANDKEDVNLNQQQSDTLQLSQNNSRFLDSSSENSDKEIFVVKTKETKYRRAHVLSTSPSSSDSEEDPTKSALCHNIPQSVSAKPNEIQSKNCQRTKKYKNVHFLSSSTNSSDEESNNKVVGNIQQNIPCKPGKYTESCLQQQEHLDKNISSNLQMKTLNNANARPIISIADIKSQFNKQSKVEELKRKLVQPNAPSVAIRKKIQKNEMLKKWSEPQRLHHGKQHIPLHNEEKITCEMKISDVPSTSKSENISSVVKEISGIINFKSVVDSQERRESLTQGYDDGAEISNLPDSNNFVSDTKMLMFGKKIRQAHNREPRNQDANKVNLKNKNTSIKSKQLNLCKNNKYRVQQQPIDSSSKTSDILGNIMSEMDNNPFKVQKSVTKKAETTPEMLGWFPPGSNPSALCGQPQNTIGVLQPRIVECQLKQSVPLGTNMTETYNPNCSVRNIPNVSYNPLSSAVIKSSNKNQTDVTDVRTENANHLKTGSKDNSKSSEHQQKTGLSACDTSLSSSNSSFVPFYSAPQEDYAGKYSKSKDKTSNSVESFTTMFSDIYPSITVRAAQLSFSNNQSEDLLSKRHCNNSISQELQPPTVPQSKTFSKLTEPAVNMSENTNLSKKKNSCLSDTNRYKIGKNSLQLTNQTEGQYMTGPFKPHTPFNLGLPRVNGGIRQSLPKHNVNHVKANAPKGIRVRFHGTEFRLAPKTSDDHVPNYSPVANSGQVSAGIESLPTASHNVSTHEDKNLTNTSSKSPTNTASISSTASSSTSDSSSSSNDSSSDSSDENGKSSCTDDSSSDGSNCKVNSSRCKDPHLVNGISNLSINKEAIDNQGNAQEQSKGSTNSKKDQSTRPIKETLSFNLEKNSFSGTSENIVHEVIVLSGSSDSESNERLLDKETNKKYADKNEKLSHIVIDPTKDKTNSDAVLQDEEGQSITNKSHIGKIRVKSLKELGVIQNHTEVENALKIVDVVSLAQSKEFETPQPETASSSNLNQQVVQQEKAKPIRRNSKNKPVECNTSNQHVQKTSVANNPSIVEVVSLAQNNDPEKSLNPSSLSDISRQSTDLEKSTSLRNSQDIPDKSTNSNPHIRNPSDPNTSKPMIYVPIFPLKAVAFVKPLNTVSGFNQEQIEERFDTGIRNSSHTEASVASQDSPLQQNVLGATSSGSGIVSQNPATLIVMPSTSADAEAKRLFFQLCDKLFTDVVNFKIPKLADDLHLLIAYDTMKEERLKKIGQLLSPETIVSEKRRAEKEYNDMIKIRGQSFVPLFMTIVNKIGNDNLKALLTAVYCKIVQQLERIDPVNNVYRFKIKTMITNMLQKHNYGINQDILAYFDTDPSFLSNFGFIENLLNEYEKYIGERQKDMTLTTGNASEELPSNIEDRPGPSNSIERGQTVGVTGGGMPPRPLPPTIGNLDNLFLKNLKRKK